MDGVAVLKESITLTHGTLYSLLQGLEESKLTWQPPGTSNSIGALLTHMVCGEDRTIHGLIQGKPPIWDRDGWGKKLDIGGDPVPFEASKEQLRTLAVRDFGTFLPYMQQVFQATDDYLSTLTAADLDQRIHIPNVPDRSLGWVLIQFINWHIAAHSGEISCLKGLQGSKGMSL